jgi:hypothetical protein
MVKSFHSCLFVFLGFCVACSLPSGAPAGTAAAAASDAVGRLIWLACTPLSLSLLTVLKPSSSVFVSDMLGGLSDSTLLAGTLETALFVC